MNDQTKTKTRLIDELQLLRKRVADLEAMEFEHKQTETALRESEKRFRNVIEGSIQGILVHQNTKPLFANQAFANILGYESPDEILNMDTVVPLIAPYEQDRLLSYHQARIKKKSAPALYEYDALCKDGSIATLQNIVTRIEWEGKPAVLSTVIDVTERKRIEEALYFIAQRGRPLNGGTFFQALVQYLAKTLNVDYAFVGKLNEDGQSVSTLALYALGQITDNIEYDLLDSPCENVMGQTLRCYPQDIQQQFPQDHLLAELEAESYAGIPLWDSAGNPLGVIVVLGRAAFTNTPLIEAILHIVAVRAAHELERRQVEHQLRESEAYYRSLFEESPISLWEEDWSQIKQLIDTLKSKGVSDFKAYFAQHPEMLKHCADITGIINVNQATLQLYKANNIEELMENLGRIFCEDTFDSPPYALLALIEGEKQYEYERVNQTLTGEKLHVLMHMVIAPGHEDTWSKILVAINDITERKLTEKALRTSKVRLKMAQAMAHVGNWELDILNQTIWASSEAFRIYGLPRTTPYLSLKQIQSMVHPEDRPHMDKALRDLIQENKTYNQKFRIYRADNGQLRTIQSKADIIRNEQNQPLKIAGVIQDITEHQQLEEQYRQAQKMEAVGRLAGGVAHDFNNLLTAIMGYIGLIEAELPPDHPIYNDIQGIQNTAQRAANLTRQLLTFARRQIVEPQTLNLNDIILNLDKLLRRLIGEDIELVTLPAPELGQVNADPGQIEQVIVNLVVNARDAMPHGGKLTIETANVTLDENYAQRHAQVTPGQYILLTISDTGCGMTAKVKAHIFEPFFTTKETGKGTGLGLATCFGIVKQCGGHIWVYSEVEKGTTFKIYLPRIKKATSSAFEDGQTDELPYGTETILLVEDEPAVRDLAARILHQQGYIILEAANGEEALHMLQEQPDLEIDLLLTDVIMPQMGGKALAEKLTGIHPNIKVIFTSGYTDNAIVQHGILDPGIIFLQKPFSPALLARKVRQVLDSV